MNLRHMQNHLPWTVPYSPEFNRSRDENHLRQVGHDVIHAMKSLGKVADVVEKSDHGHVHPTADGYIMREVASIVMACMHIATVIGGDLEEAIRTRVYEKNGEVIPEEIEPCCERDNDGDGNCDIHSSKGILR